MIIPQFKEKVIVVNWIFHEQINTEASEEAEKLKHIYDSIKNFECLPKVEEMTALLEFEEKTLNYAWELATNYSHNLGIEKEFSSIFNVVNDPENYKRALNNIEYIEYCVLEKLLNELSIVTDIKRATKELNQKYDREILPAVNDLKKE